MSFVELSYCRLVLLQGFTMFVGVVPICQDILLHPGSEEPWMTTMRHHHLAVEWWDLTKNCGWFIESYPANMRKFHR
jgi:hypothetical protein